eukprot:TRINITY_DN9702_c0_g1_i1.p1 TRINITY_DN9702_c0_g1~~TRINITY_DN9702_c0_g1_i1.p1  ORF type:complete len:248 (+),score=23.80 TRINITY_DN9702_c0_g1_i1:181-924(+)
MPTFVKRYSGQPSLAVVDLTPNIAAQMKEYSCTAQKLGYSFASWKKRRFELKGHILKYYAGSTEKGCILLGTITQAQVVVPGITLKEPDAHDYIKAVGGDILTVVQSRVCNTKMSHLFGLGIIHAAVPGMKSRTYYLMFDDERERDEMLAALRHNLMWIIQCPMIKECFLQVKVQQCIAAGMEPAQAGRVAIEEYNARVANALAKDQDTAEAQTMAGGGAGGVSNATMSAMEQALLVARGPDAYVPP